MAESFQQRIALEGAEDILKQLEAIGAAGTKAFNDLKKSIDVTNPALASLSTASKASQQAMVALGGAVGNLTQVIAPLNAGLAGLLGTFGSLARGGGILAAAGALALFVKNAADTVLASSRAAAALGLTIDQFQAISRVAKNAGISSDELSTALTRFSGQVATEAQSQFKGLVELAKQVSTTFSGASVKIVNVDDLKKLREIIEQESTKIKAVLAESGQAFLANLPPEAFATRLLQIASRTDEAGEAMRKLISSSAGIAAALTPFEKLDALVVRNEAGIKSLGVSFIDANGKTRSTIDALKLVVEQLNKLPDGAQKAAVSAKLFGRAIGPELAQALSNGTLTLDQALDAIEKFTGISADQVRAARNFQSSLNDLDSAFKQLQRVALSAFGPGFTSILKNASDDIKTLRSLLTGEVDGSILKGLTADLGKFGESVRTNFDILLEKLGITKSAIDRINQGFEATDAAPLAAPLAAVSKSGTEAAKAIESTASEVVDLATKVRSMPDLAEKIKFPPIKIDDLTTSLRPIEDAIETVKLAPEQIAPPFETAAQRVRTSFEQLGQGISQLPQQTGAALSSIPAAFTTPFQTATDQVLAMLDRVLAKIREFQNVHIGVDDQSGSSGPTDGFAGGGVIRGPGTGTSDSILAWVLGRGLIRVSNGEGILTAKALRHYGSGIVALINSLQLPKFPKMPGFAAGGVIQLPKFPKLPEFSVGGVLRLPEFPKLPGFAMGGLLDGLGASLAASLAVPRFATGGLPDFAPAGAGGFSGGRSLTLNLVAADGRKRGTFAARIDDDVARQLEQVAAREGMSLAGRPSSWNR